MGREGMARRHALYKMVSLVQGTNIIRKEHGIPEAECIAADPKLTLLTVTAGGAPGAKPAAKAGKPKAAAAKSAGKKKAKRK
jgi:hypothetical protein